MPEWPNSHNLKIQDGGCRHLEFRKNVNNSGLNKYICTKFYGKMHHGHAEMTTWRHQINVRSISASISVTITYTWTKCGTEHKYHSINKPEKPNPHNLKIQDGGGRRHLGFLGMWKTVNNSGLDTDIGIKFYGIMHWTLAYTRACTTV